MLNLFAALGTGFDDIFAITSVIGSALLLFNAFTPARKFGKIAEASYFGLIFGALGQYAIYKTNQPMDLIGFLQIPYKLVNALLLLSFLLLVLRWYINRNRYKFT